MTQKSEFFIRFTKVMNQLHQFKGELDDFRLFMDELNSSDTVENEVMELVETAFETVENEIEADLSDIYQTYI